MTIDEARKVIANRDRKALYPTLAEEQALRVLAKFYGIRL